MQATAATPEEKLAEAIEQHRVCRAELARAIEARNGHPLFPEFTRCLSLGMRPRELDPSLREALAAVDRARDRDNESLSQVAYLKRKVNHD